MAGWATGTELQKRLADHRMALGDGTHPLSQTRYAALWGRRSYKTVYEWERGNQLPAPGLIEQAISRNGWDDRMFQVGGPMPSTLPRSPAAPRSEEQAGLDAPPLAGHHALRVLELEMELAVEKNRLVTREEVRKWLTLARASRGPDGGSSGSSGARDRPTRKRA